jgi:hypothetical protein
MSQTTKAAPKSASILVEISFVDRVLKVLMSCGNSEIVVSTAPNNPRAITKSILLLIRVKEIFTLFLAPGEPQNFQYAYPILHLSIRIISRQVGRNARTTLNIDTAPKLRLSMLDNRMDL